MLIIFIFSTLCFLFYCLFWFFRIKRLIKVSRKLINKTKNYSHFDDTNKLKVLFVGDSTGVGVGASNNKDSLAGRFSRDNPKWNIVNKSISGRRTI